MSQNGNGLFKTVKEAFDMINGYFRGGASIDDIFEASKTFKYLLDPKYINFFETEIVKISFQPGSESVVIVQKEWSNNGGGADYFEDTYRRKGSTWILDKRRKSFDYCIPTPGAIFWNESYRH